MPAQMAHWEPEQKKHLLDLSSPSAMAEYFCSLYPRREVYIQKVPGQKKWSQNKRLLQDFQLLGVIEDSGRGLWRGCYWGEQTKFAVLDIDIGSRYHNTIELKKLNKLLASISLTGITYRSSTSGGWHLYVPFCDWVSSKEVETSLKQFLKAQGYEIKGGVLEVFPSGNALRLPLQPGFAWLNKLGEVETRREDVSKDEALKRFLTDFKTYENNWSEAKALIDSVLTKHREAQELEHQKAISIEGFDHIYDLGKNQERWNIGKKLWIEGLSEKGQRHDGVLAVGHYLWYGDSDQKIPAYRGSKYDRVRAKLIEAWLEKKHNGKCRHINEGNWQVVREQIARATVWRVKKSPIVREAYPLTDRLLKRLLEVYRKTGQLWEISKLEAANNARKEDARTRIKNAVDRCLEEGIQITRNGLAQIAGCSPNTVSRHKDIWFHLTTGSGVNITWGVRGVLPVSEDSAEADLSSDKVLKSSSSICFSYVLAVAPLLSCLANEPTTCTQSKDHGLKPCDVLTLGPFLRGLRAVTAGDTGGIFVCFDLRILALVRGPPVVSCFL